MGPGMSPSASPPPRGTPHCFICPSRALGRTPAASPATDPKIRDMPRSLHFRVWAGPLGLSFPIRPPRGDVGTT